MNDSAPEVDTSKPDPTVSKAIVMDSQEDPYTPGRLFGVALVGAFSSLIAYYIYQQMEPDWKSQIKKSAVSVVKGQVRNFVGSDD